MVSQTLFPLSKSKHTSSLSDLEPQIKILPVWRTSENVVKYFTIPAQLKSCCCFKKYNEKRLDFGQKKKTKHNTLWWLKLFCNQRLLFSETAHSLMQLNTAICLNSCRPPKADPEEMSTNVCESSWPCNIFFKK